MARQSVIQNQFTRGELSPRMRGRIDLEPYYQGAETLANVLPLPHGGIGGSPGLRYVAAATSAVNDPHLLPFVFNVSDAYVLEFCINSLRFFRNQGQIVANDITATISNGTFDSNITGWTEQSTGAATIAHDAANSRLQLNGNGSDVAIAEQAITITETTTNHVIRFAVYGASNSGAIKLRIGSSSGATDIVNDVSMKAGWHCYEFDPASNWKTLCTSRSYCFTNELSIEVDIEVPPVG